ncbi:MAG: hypothetical protein ACXWCG_04730 [Flavitalea sp.]
MDLEQFKPVHWLYNLFHYKELKHNREAYKKYHINKPLIASISSKDFPDKESRAWLDIGDAAILAPQKETFKQFSNVIQQKFLNWSRNGYLILENFFDKDTCSSINNEIDRLVNTQKLTFTNGNKLVFANKKSALIKEITTENLFKSILGFIL